MENLYLNLAGIAWESVVDGPGLRSVLFAQGCRHGCPGCFNDDLQPFRDATTYAVTAVLQELQRRPYLDGITFSGGDPLEQPEGFAQLARWCQEHALSVWCYTGYRWEDIVGDTGKQRLLDYVDVLVDGRYDAQQRQPSLPYRGSANQRLIDVQASRHQRSPILWQA